VVLLVDIELEILCLEFDLEFFEIFDLLFLLFLKPLPPELNSELF
jgi:hypothetical protein